MQSGCDWSGIGPTSGVGHTLLVPAWLSQLTGSEVDSVMCIAGFLQRRYQSNCWFGSHRHCKDLNPVSDPLCDPHSESRMSTAC